jgi:hypothetical protein
MAMTQTQKECEFSKYTIETQSYSLCYRSLLREGEGEDGLENNLDEYVEGDDK